MLTKEKIDQFKKELEQARDRLMREIANEEKPVDFGNDVEDFSEEADEAEEASNRTAIAHDQKKDLEEVNEALQRIEKNTYGICTNCGQEIGEDVLRIAPESSLCENCKKKE